MTVYFVTQTINENLMEDHPDLKDHKENSFLIKVGAVHEEKYEERSKAYFSKQGDNDVVFVPNKKLPFKAAGWIKDATFVQASLKSVKIEKVDGTHETFIIEDISKREDVEKSIKDWGGVNPSEDGWEAVCSWVEAFMTHIRSLKLVKESLNPKACSEMLLKHVDDYKTALHEEKEKEKEEKE